MKHTILLPFRSEGKGPWRLQRALQNVLTTSRWATARDVVLYTDDFPLTANLYCLRPRLPLVGRPTLIRTDPYFQFPLSPSRRRYLQAIAARVDCFILWSTATAERYHRFLQIPRSKMVHVPYHHIMQSQTNLVEKTGDYIFSGGNSMRDYETLIEAVRGLSVPVYIATHWKPPAALAVPDNVRIQAATHDEFVALLAGARFVVLPLQMDNLRTSGQQSYLNAMALGKAVIVTDRQDALDYIDHDNTGLLTSPGQPQELRQAILSLLENPRKVRRLGEQARQVAAPLNEENTYSRILSVAHRVHQGRLGTGRLVKDLSQGEELSKNLF